MLRRKILKKKSAQSIIEYTMIVGIAVLVISSMQSMMKWGIQSLVKVVADQVGNQLEADQGHKTYEDSFLNSSYTSVRKRDYKRTTESGGMHLYFYDSGDEAIISTNTFTNMGFTEEDSFRTD